MQNGNDFVDAELTSREALRVVVMLDWRGRDYLRTDEMIEVTFSVYWQQADAGRDPACYALDTAAGVAMRILDADGAVVFRELSPGARLDAEWEAESVVDRAQLFAEWEAQRHAA